MPTLIRKTPSGLMVSQAEKTGVIYCGHIKRGYLGLKAEAIQLLMPAENQNWFAVKDPFFTSLIAECDNYPGETSNYKDVDHQNVYCRFLGMIFMRVSRYNSGSPSVAVCDDLGNILSGCNTFPSGDLCLGDNFDPLTPGPLEAFMFNESNADLLWCGTPLGGEYKPFPENPNDEYLEVTTWPVYRSQEILIPQGVKDAASHL